MSKNQNDDFNTIKKQIDFLPKELLLAIKESDWLGVLDLICEKRKIEPKTKQAIMIEIMFIFLDLVNPLDFPKSIQDKLKTNEKDTQDLVYEISEKILEPIFKNAKNKGWKPPSEIPKDELNKVIIETKKDENLEYEDFLLFNVYQNSPEKIKDVFRSGELVQKIEKVGQKFNLQNEEKSIIESVLTVHILGELENQKIRADLEERLINQKENFGEIYKELEKEIIFPLIKNLEEKARIFEKGIEKIKNETKEPKLPEELIQKFNDLPKDLRWAIGEINVEEKMLELKQKYNMNIEQSGILSGLIYSVLVGQKHPENFEGEARMVIKLPEDKISSILSEINDKIFRNLREQLLSLHKEKDKKSIILETNTPTPNKVNINTTNKTDNSKEKAKIEDKPKPNLINSIFNQKLGGSMKMEVKETQHSLDTTKNQPNQVPKIDPYREIPE